MKLKALYFSLVLLSAFIVVSAWLFFSNPLTRSERFKDFAAIQAAESDFLQQVVPTDTVKLTQMDRPRELIAGHSTLPHFHRYPLRPLQKALHYAETCQEATVTDPKLQKLVEWAQSLCEKKKLPNNFFLKPPYMHPSGKSFVFLAWNSRREEFHNSDFLKKLQNYLHLSEMKYISDEVLNPALRKLSPYLTYEFLDALTKPGNPIQGQNFTAFFFTSERASTEEYRIYPTSTWLQFIGKYGFETTVPLQQQNCLHTHGSQCWNWSKQTIFIRNLSFYTLITSLFLFTALGGSLVWSHYRFKEQIREGKVFLLQTLVHELRTPVTTIQLSLESFRKEFESLSEKQQENLLRLLDEAQRLRRIVDRSRKYLQTNAITLQLFPETIPSVNLFLKEVLSPYEKQIQFMSLTVDTSLSADPYWLSICLKNLVENAFKHGKGAVTISALLKGKHVDITVQDEGNTAFKTLEDLEGISKNSQTRGMGFGLSIVRQVIPKMGGELRVVSQPTRFTISLERVS